MKRTAALIAILLLCCAPAWAGAAADSGCLSCHQGYQAPMPPTGKGPACTACHRGDGQARDIQAGHRNLAANPSALDQAERACGSCHPGRTARVRLSPMATNMGIIGQTRRLWGAQGDLQPRFGVRSAPGLMALPSPRETGAPVDDFLRRRCLRCHLWTKGADMPGARRPAGCAACHQGPGHRLTRRVSTERCLTCHAGCGAGAEYTGRIPRDAVAQARFLAGDPDRPQLWQGRDWRPMVPDLHYRAGLACIDCHAAEEIMGDGRLRPAGLLHVGLRCTTCHGRPGKPGSGETAHGVKLNNLRRTPKGLALTGKLDGREHIAPALAGREQGPMAHRIPAHDKVACHACHSASNPAVWGLQVLLETRSAYHQWSPIRAQGDPQVLKLLSAPRPRPPRHALPPETRDYISGRARPGMWILSPFFRRFEWRVYGRGPDGRTFLLAPRFQYVVTRLDGEGRLQEQARIPSPGLGLTPWHPHTTTRAAQGCADCHGKASALGLGLTFLRPAGKDRPAGLAPGLWRPEQEGLNLKGDWTQAVDLRGVARQLFLVPGSGPYGGQQLKRLLQPGKEYKRWLLKFLDEQSRPPVGDDPKMKPAGASSGLLPAKPRDGEPGPARQQGPGQKLGPGPSPPGRGQGLAPPAPVQPGKGQEKPQGQAGQKQPGDPGR